MHASSSLIMQSSSLIMQVVASPSSGLVYIHDTCEAVSIMASLAKPIAQGSGDIMHTP